jgi:hypothetical protein
MLKLLQITHKCVAKFARKIKIEILELFTLSFAFDPWIFEMV